MIKILKKNISISKKNINHHIIIVIACNMIALVVFIGSLSRCYLASESWRYGWLGVWQWVTWCLVFLWGKWMGVWVRVCVCARARACFFFSSVRAVGVTVEAPHPKKFFNPQEDIRAKAQKALLCLLLLFVVKILFTSFMVWILTLIWVVTILCIFSWSLIKF